MSICNHVSSFTGLTYGKRSVTTSRTVQAMAESADASAKLDDALDQIETAVRERDQALAYAKSVYDWSEEFNSRCDSGDVRDIRSMLTAFEERKVELNEARAAVAILDAKLTLSQQELAATTVKYKSTKTKLREWRSRYEDDMRAANEKMSTILRQQHQARQEKRRRDRRDIDRSESRNHDGVDGRLRPISEDREQPAVGTKNDDVLDPTRSPLRRFSQLEKTLSEVMMKAEGQARKTEELIHKHSPERRREDYQYPDNTS